MDALISLVYTIVDSVCVCLFLDAFASRRWKDHRFLIGVIVQTILTYASIEKTKSITKRKFTKSERYRYRKNHRWYVAPNTFEYH